MDKQTSLFKDIIKIMGIIPIVDKKDLKSIECALSRENKKLGNKFDKMFKILFANNDNLKKLMPIHMINLLENDIKNILYYNPIDQLSIEIIKEKYFFFPYFFVLILNFLLF